MPITKAVPPVGSNWDADQAPEPEIVAPRRRRQNLVIGAVVVALVLVAGLAVLALESRNRTTTAADAPGAATQQAQDWVAVNVPEPGRGQYVIAAAAVPRDDTSVPVAAFGSDDDRVEVRRLVPQGMVAVGQAQDAARAVRLQAGASLSGNAALSLSPDAVEEIRTGQVDERLLNVLATLAAQHHLQVADFPAVAGEEGVGAPRRTVEIDSIDFRPVTDGSAEVTSVVAFLDQQLPAYRPVAVEVTARDGGNASLRITYAYRDLGALGG